MGNRKALLPVSMALSALSALAGMLPYILIWFIVRELLAPGETIVSGNIETYAWWAAGLAVGSVILYFAALMASHLAAFRVESNLRREAMRKSYKCPSAFSITTPAGASVKSLMTTRESPTVSWPTKCPTWQPRSSFHSLRPYSSFHLTGDSALPAWLPSLYP